MRRLGERPGCDLVGAIGTMIVWFAWNYLSKVRPFTKVDDASASSTPTASPASSAACCSGIFGDPNMLEYGCGHLDPAGQVVDTSPVHLVAPRDLRPSR